MREPTHGWTRHGHCPVHARTVDHLPDETRYQRVNKRLAVAITTNVGTMTCFWLFCLLAFTAAPAALYEAGVIGSLGLVTKPGFLIVVAFVAQSVIQLVLLPAIIVGQNLQSAAADARAAKTFEDVEVVLDRLDAHTEGGLKVVLDRLDQLKTGKTR